MSGRSGTFGLLSPPSPEVGFAYVVTSQGEVIARLVVHATMGSEPHAVLTAADVLNGMSREDAVAALERIARGLPPM